ncbi:MAG: hypothetical protein K2I10_02025 [Lachnospiraceae bacterium]|nr:hypothetical protein [Lachnospiraceae bacterium]
MIITTNREPSLEEFETLCVKMCDYMNDRAYKEPDYYLSKGAQKLEPEVKSALDIVAKGTMFENTIEIISGQRFPDIVAAEYYGIEVKSTKDDKWTMIGGSVAEGTRVEDVDHIFILFGKLHKPVEFRTRRYEDCLCDIAVTHSPRYKIDMELPKGETIFDKMGITYDEMRKLDNPIVPVVKYFRSILKPGESLWWVNGEDAASGAAPAKIRMWKTLSKAEREDLISQGFALFPELFSNSPNKYERFTLWLVANHGVVSSSMRDPFSAGGQVDFEISGRVYERLPQKYHQLATYSNKVKDAIMNIDEQTLVTTWEEGNTELKNRMQRWIQLVVNAAISETFDVAQFLEDVFDDN